jgi:O-antigen polysaccharide polymerase Wzy
LEFGSNYTGSALVTNSVAWIGLGFSAVTMAALAAYSAAGSLSLSGASLFGVLIWVIGSVLLIARDSRGIWSPTVIFFNVFAVFHFGLGLMVWSGGDFRDITWFSDPAVPHAFIVAAWGGVALLLGMLLPDIGRSMQAYLGKYVESVSNSQCDDKALEQKENDPTAPMGALLLPRIGMILVIASVLAWFTMVLPLVGGRIWGLSYGEFLNATADAGMTWVYFFLSLGLALAVIEGSPRVTRWSIAIFTGWAIVALPIGLRGEVMFPAAAAIMIASHRLRRIGATAAVVLMLLGLSSAAMFKEVRNEGWSGVEWTWKTVNPVSAVQELGQSLRPTFETIRWIEGGDQFLAGGSYWAPIERGFFRLFPVQQRQEGETDRRLMNILVQERVGPIGFSPVAEAYYNWGIPGVAIVHLLMGWLVAILATNPPSLIRQGLMAATYVPLLIHIRNSFVPVIAQILVGIVIVMAMVLLEKWLDARRETREGIGLKS